MKKQILLFASISILFMGACGGNADRKSNYVENEVLGIFPSIYMELNKELKQQMTDMQNDMQSATAEKKLTELRDKYVALEDETKQNAQNLAEAELEKIADRMVPFTVMYEHPDFELRTARVDWGYPETGALSINLVIGAKRNLVPSMNASMNYVIKNTKGELIFSGKINPFVSIQTVTSSQFAGLQNVAAGDVCCWEGSRLMLYCASYDFTEFAEIIFVE